VRKGFRVVIFAVVTLVLGLMAYNAWWELAVLRCRPDDCGLLSDVAWEYSLVMVIVCQAIAGGFVWAVGRRAFPNRQARLRQRID